MCVLDKIKEPVACELAEYEKYLHSSLESDHPMTMAMVSYILQSRGKAIRPLITLLSASMFKNGEGLPEESFLGAMLVEMMHTASLVHDDVIDEAYVRRGKPSVKALWRSHRAVLIGDYILAKSYAVAMHSGYFQTVSAVVGTMSLLCEGELLQSDQSDRLEMTREIYDEIIYKKTAVLIGASSRVGAMSAGACEEDIANMKKIGEALGMAFQIKDDILDYASAEKTGKPLCADIKERKVNLPLLMVMESVTAKEKDEIIALLSDVRTEPGNADRIYDMVIKHKGLEMASGEMAKYIDEALALLEKYPASPYRDSLIRLCGYVAEREV